MSEHSDIKELIKATARIEQKLDTTHSWVKDLNARVTSVERWVWYASGVTAIVVYMISHFLK